MIEINMNDPFRFYQDGWMYETAQYVCNYTRDEFVAAIKSNVQKRGLNLEDFESVGDDEWLDFLVELAGLPGLELFELCEEDQVNINELFN